MSWRTGDEVLQRDTIGSPRWRGLGGPSIGRLRDMGRLGKGAQATALRAAGRRLLQQAAVFRAFDVAPALLLLDEPFASLDDPTRTRLVPELERHLREQGAAAVFVTHDERDGRVLADRV